MLERQVWRATACIARGRRTPPSPNLLDPSFAQLRVVFDGQEEEDHRSVNCMSHSARALLLQQTENFFAFIFFR